MSEQATRPILFPVHKSSEVPVDDEPKLSWLKRRLIDLGVYEMGNHVETAHTPPAGGVNWTMLSSVVAILTAIVALWYFTWQTAEQRGLDKGAQMERERQSEARIQALERELLIKKKTEEVDKKR
jgi:hypothetical protein